MKIQKHQTAVLWKYAVFQPQLWKFHMVSGNAPVHKQELLSAQCFTSLTRTVSNRYPRGDAIAKEAIAAGRYIVRMRKPVCARGRPAICENRTEIIQVFLTNIWQNGKIKRRETSQLGVQCKMTVRTRLDRVLRKNDLCFYIYCGICQV